MTEKEKSEIILEVKASIMEEMKGKCIKEDTQSALAAPRNKWFVRSTSKDNPSPMYKIFGTYAYWQVWENIRKLTCLICGVGYCRQLNGNMKADEIADKICEFIYNLRDEQVNSCKESEVSE